MSLEKILVHLSTNEMNIYSLKNGTLSFLKAETIDFTDRKNGELPVEKIGYAFKILSDTVGEIDNERIRIYATGCFQKYTREEKTKLVIEVFVLYGVYFNIVEPDLEDFYIKRGEGTQGCESLMEGLVKQEFRKVVICGSFQQHLDDIGTIMDSLQKRNVEVLSPWTTKIVPETIGTDFILLEGQEPLRNKRDAWKHKFEHMEKFQRSDAIIICNPDKIVGIGTMFEFGYMVAYSKRIIFLEKPVDLIPFPYEVGLNI